MVVEMAFFFSPILNVSQIIAFSNEDDFFFFHVDVFFV